MGVYTSIIDEDGIEIQIKTGNDWCDTYKIGDVVKWKIFPDYYMQSVLLDGVYWGCGWPESEPRWVVIKNHRVLGTYSCEEFEHDELAEKYAIEPPDPSWWTEEARERHEKMRARSREEFDKFEASIAHLPAEERLGKVLTYPIRHMLDYQSVLRNAFVVETIEKEKNDD